MFNFILKEQKGATLLELIVATVVTAILGLAIYNVCSMAMDAWQKGEARTQKYQNIRIALDRMTEEIRGAITLNPDYNPGKDIYFIGANNGTNDTLSFISIAHPPDGSDYGSTYSPLSLKFDCCELGFYLSGNMLIRQKQVANVPDNDITSGGSPDELAPYITGLNFRYHNGTGWQDTWDASPSGDNGLPRAVEITLTATASSSKFIKESVITTIVYLANQ